MSNCVKPGAPGNSGADLRTCEVSVFEGGNLIPDNDTIEVDSDGEITMTKDGNRDCINIAFEGGFLALTGDFTIKLGAEIPQKGAHIVDDQNRFWVVSEAPKVKAFSRGRPVMVNLKLEFHPVLSLELGGTDDGYLPGVRARAQVEVDVIRIDPGDYVAFNFDGDLKVLQSWVHLGPVMDGDDFPTRDELAAHIVENFSDNRFVKVSREGALLIFEAVHPGVRGNDILIEGLLSRTIVGSSGSSQLISLQLQGGSD